MHIVAATALRALVVVLGVVAFCVGLALVYGG